MSTAVHFWHNPLTLHVDVFYGWPQIQHILNTLLHAIFCICEICKDLESQFCTSKRSVVDKYSLDDKHMTNSWQQRIVNLLCCIHCQWVMPWQVTGHMPCINKAVSKIWPGKILFLWLEQQWASHTMCSIHIYLLVALHGSKTQTLRKKTLSCRSLWYMDLETDGRHIYWRDKMRNDEILQKVEENWSTWFWRESEIGHIVRKKGFLEMAMEGRTAGRRGKQKPSDITDEEGYEKIKRRTDNWWD